MKIQRTFPHFLKRHGILGLLLFSVLAYQNCAKVDVTDLSSKADVTASGAGRGGGGDEETRPIDPSSPVICDPFSYESNCSTAPGGGLIGNIYYLERGGSVQEYITRGQKLNVTLNLSNLNIAPRSWDLGFPGAEGLIVDAQGNVLNEYFAFDLQGHFRLPAGLPSGLYDFAVLSDDGSLLDLNGRTVVNNDGVHAVRTACSRQPIQINQNQAIPMRVRYFQGPRVEIALQVFYRASSGYETSCNLRDGDWELIPSESLSH